MGLYFNVQYTIKSKRCIGNTIYSLVIVSRVVSIGATNTMTKYKIVRLSFKFNSGKCNKNHISSYMNIDEGIILFKCSIKRCIGYTFNIVATFSKVIPLR